MTETASERRPVRSFVRRPGRLTIAQREALATLLPSYDLAPMLATASRTTAFEEVFGRSAPNWMEIGFGNGEALLQMAARFPEVNFIGAEVHDPGVGRLLMGLQEQALTNVRVLHGDATELLRAGVADGALDRVMVFFPDPWPKKRHHKRRLINPATLALFCRCLRPRGVLHLATDWRDYAEHMLEALATESRLRNLHPGSGYAPDTGIRPQTHFERRGLRLGHEVFDILCERVEAS